jgi:hypothetical protein
MCNAAIARYTRKEMHFLVNGWLSYPALGRITYAPQNTKIEKIRMTNDGNANRR